MKGMRGIATGRHWAGRTFVLAVATSVMLVAGWAQTAHAGYQFLWWSEDGNSFTSVGPNVVVTIHTGRIAHVAGCGIGGSNDMVYPFSDIYVIPSGSLSPGVQLSPLDPAGTPNTVATAGSDGTFVSETIGSTGPSGKIGEGRWAVVYDECQNGTFEPDIDAVFDAALEVMIPIDAPSLPPAAMAKMKADAPALELQWTKTYSSLKTLFQLLELVKFLDTLRSPVGLMMFGLKLVWKQALGISVTSLGTVHALNLASHYRGIAADPPDPAFQQLTPAGATEIVFAPSTEPTASTAAQLGSALSNEEALTQALLSSLERYQGADQARNGRWSLVHARAIQGYARALTQQLSDTTAAAGALRSAVAADTRDVDTAANRYDDFRTRVLASGFTEEELRESRNLGFDSSEIEAVRTALQDDTSGPFTEQSLLELLAEVPAHNSQMQADLNDLATDMQPLIDSLVSDGAPSGPIARPGGPYAADEGSPVTFDGSQSGGPFPIASYEWDLDGDSVFDDATGAMPLRTYGTDQRGIVGLRVTDTSGQASIAYARVTITSINDPPVLTGFNPPERALQLETGTAQDFSVTATDPDGDPATVDWILEGTPVASGFSFSYRPTLSEIGMRFLEARASDGSSLGGTTLDGWRVLVVALDGDGDGWRANVDCDDSDPMIHAGHAEVIANGKDDDCDPATSDQGSTPKALFNPVTPGRNVALLEAGATVVEVVGTTSGSPQAMLDYPYEPEDHNYWQSSFTPNRHVTVLLADGGPYLIDRVRMALPNDAYVQDFAVDVSTTTAEASAFTNVLTAKLQLANGLQEFSFPPTMAKYVRYRPLSSYFGASVMSTNVLKVITGQQSGNTTVQFRNLSTDADADIVSTSWDFGDGITSTESGPTHTYLGPGTYNVTLTVMDAGGNSNSFSLPQRVLQAPSGIGFTIPAGLKEGDIGSYDAVGADPDGGTIVHYQWHWDDLTADTFGNPGRHVFGDNSTYQVRLTVADSQEQTTAITLPATPLNVAPSMILQDDGLYPTTIAALVTLGSGLALGSKIVDPGFNDGWTCHWDYGDGTSSNGPCFFAHKYALAGQFDVHVTITDDDGASGNANPARIDVYEPVKPLPLTNISTTFNTPIGIDYHPPTNSVVISANYSTGEPNNFELVAQDGSHRAFSEIHGLRDEIKIASVRGGPCQGGFQTGELFVGTGAAGVIARISPDGTSFVDPWIKLPGETGLMRGGLFQDRYCIFGGDLLAVTTAGGVWRINSAGVATKLAALGTHLEGVSAIPNDPARYGPWAGTLLTGAEEKSIVYSVSPDGTVTPYNIGINPEDIDIIPADENFFGVNIGQSRIAGAPASEFADKQGDILITQEYFGGLWNVHWNPAAGAFEKTRVGVDSQWEHVTFAPSGIVEIPPSNSAPTADSQNVSTPFETAINITLMASDPDSDPLEYSVINSPSHGTLAGLAPNQTYTPATGYSGSDSFTFRVTDGIFDSNVATISITIGSGPNLRPAIAAIADQTMDEGESLDVSVSAADPESDPITLSATGLPYFATFADGGDGTGKVSVSPTDDATATINIQACDDGGCVSRTFSLAVGNLAPTAFANNSGPIDEGGTVTVTASQTDPGSADTFDYSFDCDGDNAFEPYQPSGTVSCSFPLPGSFPVGVRVRDDDGGVGTAQTTVLVREKTRSTSTTFTGSTKVQYSDAAALTAQLLDTSASPNAPIPGLQLSFTLGQQTTSAGPTDGSGNAETSLIVTQKPGSVSAIDTVFSGDPGHYASADRDAFEIIKEDCTLNYSGDTLVPPVTNTILAADIGEPAPDTSLGDRSNKRVMFIVTDAAETTHVLEATTDTDGRASASAALPDGAYGVMTVFGGDDFYHPCGTPTDTLVTVASASAKVTGGGWISVSTGRTSFGFNAIPLAGGGWRGQFQLRATNAKRDFHGDVVLTLSASGKSATWNGTGKWLGQPGYRYSVSVVDNGSGRKLDTISITIKDPNGTTTLYTTGGPQTLKGGNVTVH